MGSKAPDQGKEKAVDNQQVLPALIKHITAVSLGPGRRAAFRGLEALGFRVTMTEICCKGHCGQNRSPGKKWGQGRRVGSITFHFQSPSPSLPKTLAPRLQPYAIEPPGLRDLKPALSIPSLHLGYVSPHLCVGEGQAGNARGEPGW